MTHSDTLQKRGFPQVLALDLLGFGRSDKPLLSYTLELWRDLVLDFLAEFCAGAPAVLIGNSMGSLICLNVRERRPLYTHDCETATSATAWACSSASSCASTGHSTFTIVVMAIRLCLLPSRSPLHPSVPCSTTMHFSQKHMCSSTAGGCCCTRGHNTGFGAAQLRRRHEFQGEYGPCFPQVQTKGVHMLLDIGSSVLLGTHACSLHTGLTEFGALCSHLEMTGV